MSTKQAAIDWKTVATLFGGGALVGAGAGAVTSYIRHLDALKREAQAQRDTSQDDDVLYINVNGKPKQASDDSASGATFATGTLGSMLGAWLAYNGVRGRYNAQRKQDLQQQLDEAQRLYVDKLQTSNPKQASFPALSVGSGTVGLATLLTMLGTAAVANRALTKQFPTTKSPDRNRPKRIVLQRTPKETTVPEEVVEELPEKNSPDAKESMLRFALRSETKESAYNWSDVVSAVAQGRGPELDNLCSQGFTDAIFDVCRGASQLKTSNVNRQLALSWLAHDPKLATALEPYMAASVLDATTNSFAKLASGLSPEMEFHAVKLAEAASQVDRAWLLRGIEPLNQWNKQALMETEMATAKALQGLLQDNQPTAPEADELEPLRDQGSIVGKSQDSKDQPTLEVRDEEAKAFLAKYGPQLQAALT